MTGTINNNMGNNKGKGVGGHERAYEGSTNEWLTPLPLIQALGQFDVDPCSPINRPWDTALKHYTIIDDGLKQRWDAFIQYREYNDYLIEVCQCRCHKNSVQDVAHLNQPPWNISDQEKKNGLSADYLHGVENVNENTQRQCKQKEETILLLPKRYLSKSEDTTNPKEAKSKKETDQKSKITSADKDIYHVDLTGAYPIGNSVNIIGNKDAPIALKMGNSHKTISSHCQTTNAQEQSKQMCYQHVCDATALSIAKIPMNGVNQTESNQSLNTSTNCPNCEECKSGYYLRRVFCNPPYGPHTKHWLKKMVDHNNGVVLIFARTETQPFFEYVWG